MPRKLSALLLPIAVTSVLVCFGCEANRAAANHGSLEEAITAYESRQYPAAQKQAGDLAAASTGAGREQAAYLAGLSAYQQGLYAEADQNLSLAANSADRTLAGQAKAQLGLVRMRQNRPREAAVLFSAAASALEGEDSRRAEQQAALAHERAGDDAAAKTSWLAAAARPGAALQPSSSSTPPAASASPAAKGFTLQIGAYQQRALAENALADAQRLSDQHGLGPVRIVGGSDERGRPLHLVQVGRFDTPAAATSARQRLGKLGYIVAPLAKAVSR